MGMFGAIGNAMKGGLKPNLVKKMLPGMGGQSKPQSAGGVPQVNTGGMKPPAMGGGLGPSNLSNFGKFGSAIANKMGGGMPMKPGAPQSPMPMGPPPGPQYDGSGIMGGQKLGPLQFNPGMAKTGMGINRPPINPATVGRGGIPPDYRARGEAAGNDMSWMDNPANLSLGPQQGQMWNNKPQGMGPSPQGMSQLLAKMRGRNTGVSGRM